MDRWECSKTVGMPYLLPETVVMTRYSCACSSLAIPRPISPIEMMPMVERVRGGVAIANYKCDHSSAAFDVQATLIAPLSDLPVLSVVAAYQRDNWVRIIGDSAGVRPVESSNQSPLSAN